MVERKLTSFRFQAYIKNLSNILKAAWANKSEEKRALHIANHRAAVRYPRGPDDG